ncbi:MAG: sugar ABC transporter permease, partial [Anaerolineales bacterium]
MVRSRKDELLGWLTVIPALVSQILFIYLPLATALYISFNNWNLIRPMRWVGLDNYTTMFATADFWNSLKI